MPNIVFKIYSEDTITEILWDGVAQVIPVPNVDLSTLAINGVLAGTHTIKVTTQNNQNQYNYFSQTVYVYDKDIEFPIYFIDGDEDCQGYINIIDVSCSKQKHLYLNYVPPIGTCITKAEWFVNDVKIGNGLYALHNFCEGVSEIKAKIEVWSCADCCNSELLHECLYEREIQVLPFLPDIELQFLVDEECYTQQEEKYDKIITEEDELTISPNEDWNEPYTYYSEGNFESLANHTGDVQVEIYIYDKEGNVVESYNEIHPSPYQPIPDILKTLEKGLYEIVVKVTRCGKSVEKTYKILVKGVIEIKEVDCGKYYVLGCVEDDTLIEVYNLDDELIFSTADLLTNPENIGYSLVEDEVYGKVLQFTLPDGVYKFKIEDKYYIVVSICSAKTCYINALQELVCNKFMDSCNECEKVAEMYYVIQLDMFWKYMMGLLHKILPDYPTSLEYLVLSLEQEQDLFTFQEILDKINSLCSDCQQVDTDNIYPKEDCNGCK